jgi:flagellar biosynthesis/type III secretory pathway chaperone
MTLVKPSADRASHPLPWNQLCLLLKKMAGSLQDLQRILSDEESAMRTLDREKIENLLMRKEQVLRVLSELEKEAMVIVEPWMSVQDSRNWWLLIRQGHNDRNPEWDSLYEEIECMAGRIQSQGRKNEVLIRRGRQVVGEAVRLMLSGLGQVAVYEEKGTWRTQNTHGTVSFHG